jgi:hypothetical protein
MTADRYIWYIALLLALPAFSAGQDGYTPSISIEENARQVSIDPFGNLYLLRQEREFVKYNRDGKQEASHTDLQLSELSEISSDHPFKAMIYYPEYELIRVFGNKLQMLAELKLTLYGFGEVTAVGPSTGYQAFWVFDATAQKLIRINQSYEIVDQGSDLIPVLAENIFPTMIKEREGWVYVYDPERGLYIFDNFGAFSRKLNITGARSFSIFNERIFYISGRQLFEFDRFTNSPIRLDVELDGEIMGMTFRQIAVSKNGTIELVRF